MRRGLSSSWPLCVMESRFPLDTSAAVSQAKRPTARIGISTIHKESTPWPFAAGHKWNKPVITRSYSKRLKASGVSSAAPTSLSGMLRREMASSCPRSAIRGDVSPARATCSVARSINLKPIFTGPKTERRALYCYVRLNHAARCISALICSGKCGSTDCAWGFPRLTPERDGKRSQPGLRRPAYHSSEYKSADYALRLIIAAARDDAERAPLGLHIYRMKQARCLWHVFRVVAKQILGAQFAEDLRKSSVEFLITGRIKNAPSRGTCQRSQRVLAS